jgi:hypothetical protein
MPRYRSLVDPYGRINTLLMILLFNFALMVYYFVVGTSGVIGLFTNCNDYTIATVNDIYRQDYINCHLNITYNVNNKTYTNSNVVIPCNICLGKNCDKLYVCYQHFNPELNGAYDPSMISFTQSVQSLFGYLSLATFLYVIIYFNNTLIRREITYLTTIETIGEVNNA